MRSARLAPTAPPAFSEVLYAFNTFKYTLSTAGVAAMACSLPNVSVKLRLQVLKPSTLVGTELKPPVGHAKDWMWNGDTVVHMLTRLLGPAGAEHQAFKCK